MNTTPLLARLVNKVRPNTLRHDPASKRWYKRRRAWAIPIIAAGNFVMWAGRQPIVTAITARGWQQQERQGYDALHAGLATACPDARGGLWMTALPGGSLKDERRLAPTTLRACGAELARAHRCHIDGLAFRHGDPHLGNFTYCPERQRAYLIDFETRYLRCLDADQARVEDLFVLLLDLAGRAATKQEAARWSELALEGYGPQAAQRVALVARLRRVAWGLERIFLCSRAQERPWRELRRRLDAIAATASLAPV